MKKFRIWDAKNKVMIYPDKEECGLFTNGNARYIIDGFGNIRNHYSLLVEENMILLQYVGVDDKNKTEIYEGDLLNYRFDGVFHIENNSFVKRVKSQFVVNRDNFCPVVSDCDTITITGNIYETA